MLDQRWLLYALLSAACAAFVGIFGKLGMKGIDSNLATAVRSVVMTLFLLGVCSVLGIWSKVHSLHTRAITMIIFSGLAGALSWLFYFKALQWGEVTQVAPIDKLSMPFAFVFAVLLLGDRPSGLNWLGVLVMVGGAYLAAIPAHR